jgi:hypothetical protein
VKARFQLVNSTSKSIIKFLLLIGLYLSSCSKVIDEVYDPLVGHNWVVYLDGYPDRCLLRFNTDLSTLRCGSDIGAYDNNSNVIINFPWRAPYFQQGVETFKCNCAGDLEENTDPFNQTIEGPSGIKYKSKYLIRGYYESLKPDGSINATEGRFIAYRIE